MAIKKDHSFNGYTANHFRLHSVLVEKEINMQVIKLVPYKDIAIRNAEKARIAAYKANPDTAQEAHEFEDAILSEMVSLTVPYTTAGSRAEGDGEAYAYKEAKKHARFDGATDE